MPFGLQGKKENIVERKERGGRERDQKWRQKNMHFEDMDLNRFGLPYKGELQ